MNELTIKPQRIKDDAGNELGVFLTVAEFNQLLDEIEDMNDIRAYDKAKNLVGVEEIPFAQAVEEIKKTWTK